jgi:hypothetical protein
MIKNNLILIRKINQDKKMIKKSDYLHKLKCVMIGQEIRIYGFKIFNIIFEILS